jgi:hypothetical protein
VYSATLGFQLYRSRAALRLDGSALLVEADQCEHVSVEIFEVCEHPTPKWLLAGCCRVVSRCLPLVLDAFQARRILKPNSAPTPFVKLGGNILSDKDDLGVPANEHTFLGVGLGGDQRKHGAAVRRGNRYPALTGSEANVADQTEPKLST